MNALSPPIIETDGFYHPQTEEEIIALVQRANAKGLQVRCRGAAHSMAHAIYTDPGEGQTQIPKRVSEKNPPKGPHINIRLDRFRSLIWEDEERGIVVAESGIHLGEVPDETPLEDSFLYKIWHKKTGPCQGWALNDIGGITHQTISGFSMTGSAGGSLQYALTDNILAFRAIDGRGEAQWFEKDKDPEFYALGSSLGVLGIITKIRFQLTPKYYIKGEERTTPTQRSKCQIDLFGTGTDTQLSLEAFFKQTPYCRIMWWPQEDCERIVVWAAERTVGDEQGCSIKPSKIHPYYEFSSDPIVSDLEQLGTAILYMLLGMSDNKTAAQAIQHALERFKEMVEVDFESAMKEHQHKIPEAVYMLLSNLLQFGINRFTVVPLRAIAKYLLPQIIDLIQPLTTDKRGVKTFGDVYYNILPKDNNVDDELMGTEFTELWIPVQYCQKVMQLLRDYYQAHREKEGNNTEVTGAFPNELYAGHSSPFWMHAGYTNGEDEFSEGCVRFDLFWYTANDGAPDGKGDYFDQFWRLFRDHQIPYRFVPDYDVEDWTAYYSAQFPKMKDFLALRAQRDPNNIFLNTYWARRLYGSGKIQ